MLVVVFVVVVVRNGHSVGECFGKATIACTMLSRNWIYLIEFNVE